MSKHKIIFPAYKEWTVTYDHYFTVTHMRLEYFQMDKRSLLKNNKSDFICRNFGYEVMSSRRKYYFYCV